MARWRQSLDYRTSPHTHVQFGAAREIQRRSISGNLTWAIVVLARRGGLARSARLGRDPRTRTAKGKKARGCVAGAHLAAFLPRPWVPAFARRPIWRARSLLRAGTSALRARGRAPRDYTWARGKRKSAEPPANRRARANESAALPGQSTPGPSVYRARTTVRGCANRALRMQARPPRSKISSSFLPLVLSLSVSPPPSEHAGIRLR